MKQTPLERHQKLGRSPSPGCGLFFLPGQPISEHGKGSAVDISALVLKNGVTIEVEDGWRDPVAGKVLRGVHGAACGPFQTVLGPDSDRFHRDHLHLDTADRRGRAVCR